MAQLDFGDMTDLSIRLQVLAEQADRKLVTVFGSGLSNSVLPDVRELTDLFREQIPPRGLAKFDENIAPDMGTPLGYQNAASLLTYQVGEQAVMRAIRIAVLRACTDIDPSGKADAAVDEDRCRERFKNGTWNVPLGYQRFARFFASLNGRVRGPIITTNFDPLIEIALRQEGLPAVAIPIPVDSVPTPSQLEEATEHPVLHIHGYWTGKATSNVPARLTVDRPQLDQVLREILRNSVVLVLGYSGWVDGFMKSLRARILNEATLLETDVLWAAYDKTPGDIQRNGTVAELLGTPGFTLYLGIDGHELFRDDESSGRTNVTAVPTPFGYSLVPQIANPKNDCSTDFADGAQPSWKDAFPGQWPMLDSAHVLEREIRKVLNSGGGGGAVALGPLGEGKSLALKQVALSVASEYPDWRVIWREPGAPPVTDKWVDALKGDTPTLICVDDADLVADGLVATRTSWASEASGLAFLLASHDRLWQRTGKKLGSSVAEALFHGISPTDAADIATVWNEKGLLQNSPSASTDTTVIADHLMRSAGAMTASNKTLFGAVLDIRFGSKLSDRVEDLLKKLRDVKLSSDVNLGDVFAGICVMQSALDKDGSQGRGASRSVIAAMAGLSSVFADGKILETLGREAAVTFAGARVYSRHPAIALAVVRAIERDHTAQGVYTLVGKAGGALRTAGAGDEDGYRDAYMLSKHLDSPQATWAATGAVVGAGTRLLEPRVTLLSAKRRNSSTQAVEYARALAPRVHEYEDYPRAIRAFLVDFSIAERNEGQAQTATGLAAISLDDRIGFSLDVSRAGYALVSLAKAALNLRSQTRSRQANQVPEICYVLLGRVEGEHIAGRHLGIFRRQMQSVEEIERLSSAKMAGLLASALSQLAERAIRDLDLDIAIGASLYYDSLGRLAEQRR